MFRAFQASLVACIAIGVFLFLASRPSIEQPVWYQKVVANIRAHLSSGAGDLQDKLAEEITKILRVQYGYEIGPHRRLQLLAPPLLVDWVQKKRPAGFYHYANTISQPNASYSESELDVYAAYGRFLDSIDLEKLAGGEEDSWPDYLKTLKTYTHLVSDSGGIESEHAKKLRRDIEGTLADEDARAKKDGRSKRDQALQIYAAAKLKFSDLAYKVNVEDSEDAWLQPSFKMSPAISDWVGEAPEFQPEPITGFTTIALTESQAVSPENAGAVKADPSIVPTTTTQASANATLTYKHIGRIVVTPGKWFDPFVVKYFSKGPFRSGTKMWGPDGDFPSMPVAFIVAEDPSVALDVSGIAGSIAEATVTSVGPIKFPKSDIKVTSDGSKTTLVHSLNRVYLLAVVSIEMPYVQ